MRLLREMRFPCDINTLGSLGAPLSLVGVLIHEEFSACAFPTYRASLPPNLLATDFLPGGLECLANCAEFKAGFLVHPAALGDTPLNKFALASQRFFGRKFPNPFTIDGFYTSLP